MISCRAAGIASMLALAIVLGCSAFWPNASLAQGCAMCATAVGSSEARGMNISILFLMSMPFVLTGSVGGWLWYSYRRSQRRRPTLHVLGASREGTS